MSARAPTTPLSSWSQTAPRDYIGYALCFPFDNSRHEEARSHLEDSLRRLAAARPEFAGVLHLSADESRGKTGELAWVPGGPSAPSGSLVSPPPTSTSTAPAPASAASGHMGAATILSSFEDISAQFETSYEKLQAQGFPPAVFARPIFRLGINPNPADNTQHDQQVERCPQHIPQHATLPGQGRGSRGPLAPSAVPVSIVRAFVIHGGLILFAHLHHGVGDGGCMRIFVECLGAATRGVEAARPSGWSQQVPRSIAAAEALAQGATPECLAEACPEYTYLPGRHVGPTQPVLQEGGEPVSSARAAAKIFVFKNRIAELRQLLEPHQGDRNNGGPHDSPRLSVTPYIAIAALAWSHMAHARVNSEKKLLPPPTPEVATITNPLSWKMRFERQIQHKRDDPSSSSSNSNSNSSRQFEELRGYFGNATIKCRTSVGTDLLLMAASSATSRGDAECALREVACAIRQSIDAVDEAFVARRTALYAALPDPRHLGLVDDPRRPVDLQFNTWRPFGADAEFGIPGLLGGPGAGLQPPSSTKPDAVRKAMVGDGGVDFRNALIMPARRGVGEYELLVCLPEESLLALCRDEGFMRWVDRVVG